MARLSLLAPYLFYSSLLFAGFSFEPNRGQTAPQVSYLARTSAGALLLSADGELVFRNDAGAPALRLRFPGAEPKAQWQTAKPSGRSTHYYIGRDPSKWIHDLASFERLTRRGIYPGIDLVLYSNKHNQLEYDFVLAPGADASRIRLAVGSDAATHIDPATGDLVVRDGKGAEMLRQHKPVVYQGETRIDGRFRRLNRQEFGFELARYDKTKPLVIDPVVDSLSYIGGSGDDSVASASRTGDIAGTTTSIDLPGAYLPAQHGKDVFIYSNKTLLVFGGSGDDNAAVSDLSSTLERRFIAGTTSSRDLPTKSLLGQDVPNHAQLEFAGGATDGFYAFLQLSLTPTVYVSYFGTEGDDRIESYAHAGGDFLLVGSTNGGILPFAAGHGPQPTAGGGWDALVATGSWSTANASPQLYTSSFLGGSGDDFGYAASLGPDGAKVGGETSSADFPLRGTAPTPTQARLRGATDGFIARLARSAPGSLLHSSFVGGSGKDRVTALANQVDGQVMFAGVTDSSDFPTVQAAQAAYGGGSSDAFYGILSAGFAQLLRSSYLGGSGTDEALAIAFEPSGDLTVAGRTSSRNFPVQDAVQSAFGGGASDGFLFRLYGSSGIIRQSTYLGGSGDDEIAAISCNNGGIVCVAGSTTSTNLPGGTTLDTSALVEPRRVGTREAFTARIGTSEIVAPARVAAGPGAPTQITVQVPDGRKAEAAGTITARTSDASAVLLSFQGEAVAAETMPFRGNIASIWIECMSASGSADITVTIPGFSDQVIRVVCVQPELRIGAGNTVHLDSAPSFVLVQAFSVDPVTAIAWQSAWRENITRGPIAPAATASVSPALLTLKESTISLAAYSGFWISPTTSLGEAVMTVSAPGFKPASHTFTIIQAPSRDLYVAGGYSTSVDLSSIMTRPVTVRSLDPGKVLLDTDSTNATGGTATVVVSTNSTVYVRGVPGTPAGAVARLEITGTGIATPLTRTVIFAQPAISVNPIEPFSRMTAGTRTTRSVRLVAGDNLAPLVRSPGLQPIEVAVTNSNPAVLEVPASVHIPPGSESVDLTWTARAAGAANLTFTPPVGLIRSPSLPTVVTVQVTSPALGPVADFDLGKDLATLVSVAFPAGLANPPSATISTSTPSLLQLRSSLPPFTAGARLDGVQVSEGRYQFWVEGLASQGEGVIHIEVSGVAAVQVRVRLRPVGFVWRDREVVLPLPFSSGQSLVLPAALDPVSGMPLELQSFRLGVDPPEVTADSSNPTFLVYTPGSTSFKPLQTPGEAILTLRTPAGFPTPAIMQRVRVTYPAAIPFPKPRVRLLVVGNGSVSGFNCGSSNPCTKELDYGSTVTLTATPAPGYRLEGFYGEGNGCSGNTCTFVANTDSAVSVVFVPDTGALNFVPVTPCRLVDTRNAAGALGGPAIAANGSRTFPIRSACTLPSNAAAYSLNVTVVPKGPLGYLTIWPGGQTQPLASTLNSLDGRIKANAALVPAGATDGSVSVYATDATDIILDVNGVFVPQGTNANGQSFYPVTPCRLDDTRIRGGGTLSAGGTMTVSAGNLCGVPSQATALVLNITAIPKGPLGYVTVWPSGSNSVRPTVSTLNALTGVVTANMAIVPAEPNGVKVNLFATDATEMVVDVTGYFAPPGSAVGALNFHTVAPCRVLDTRLTAPAGGPVIEALATRDVVLANHACLPVSSGAKAYSLNATVVPPAVLGYLTLYPSGATSRPVVSTLNAVDGSITSNAAIVPAGMNGAISAFVTERTHLLLDINGYFAP